MKIFLGQNMHPLLNPNISLIMNQAYLLCRAKQRDTQAIITLLNQSLQARKVKVVEAAVEDSCLKLKIQSKKVPNYHQLLPFIRDELNSLGIELINQVRVYGSTLDCSFPAWEKSLTLKEDLSLVKNMAICSEIPSKSLLTAQAIHRAKRNKDTLTKKTYCKSTLSPKSVSTAKMLWTFALIIGCSWGIVAGIYYTYQKSLSKGQQAASSISQVLGV